MESKLLFLRDAYLRNFSGEVIKADHENKTVILDKTALYPGGGGQPADRGRLHFGGVSSEVVGMKKEDQLIWHILEGIVPEEGLTVQGEVDWERRYRLMRTHTAMHILCGVIWRDYQAQVTGGNMEPLNGRMDFEFENMTADLVSEIEMKINDEVKKEREVAVDILPREEAEKIPDLIRTKINLLPKNLKEIRIVNIKGLDLQADGGTHVGNTKEVGQIRITDYKSKGRINKRIKIQLEEKPDHSI